MKYEQVQTCAKEYPVHRVCAVLGVSESGYYAWLKREPSLRQKANAELATHITALWQAIVKQGGPYLRSTLNYKIKGYMWVRTAWPS